MWQGPNHVTASGKAILSQMDKREVRDGDLLHDEKTAICVGAPSCSSTVPTGAKRTV